ncbi:Dabb family protein [Nibricoccus sp. IMCC34717]|uniref:Dabb family protein n=1 Tax=Nibricoccus sp. IMCC34717 TaxID=3034021 RepID=UPI00384F694B
MLVHTVYFWLRPDLSADETKAFVAGLESLRAIKSVRQLFIGRPAGVADRPVVDKSFSFGLTVIVDDVAGHDAYQTDPVHLAFVAAHKTKWTRVQIYDSQ